MIDLLPCFALNVFLAHDQFALVLCLSHLCVIDFLFCLFFWVVDELACSFVLFVANLQEMFLFVSSNHPIVLMLFNPFEFL